ncbi:MAG: tetratricopeptide repeat protein [Cyclobacteriaceae bacterium]
MYKKFTIALYLTILTCLSCFGQVESPVIPFIQHASSSEQEHVVLELQEEINSYSQLLNKSKDQSRFIKRLFYKIQRDHLFDYTHNAQLDEIFIGQKEYDCVTGTALYALVLNSLNIDFSIKETDFHVYLLVHLPGKDILLEPTDPIYGFIDNPIVISDRIRTYRNGEAFGSSENGLSVNSKSNSFHISFYRDRVISLQQLAGLQYYNLSTHAFNNGNHEGAIELIEIALSLYPNDRFSGFRDILLVDMSQSMSTNYSPDQE